MPKVEPTGLAQYTTLDRYVPQYGDYVVWSGWFTTWHGLVCAYDSNTTELSIVFEGTPSLLLTLTENEIEQNIRKFKLAYVRAARKNGWAIYKHDTQRNTTVWYI